MISNRSDVSLGAQVECEKLYDELCAKYPEEVRESLFGDSENAWIDAVEQYIKSHASEKTLYELLANEKAKEEARKHGVLI